MSAASLNDSGSLLGDLSDLVGGPADSGELRMNDTEPATELGVGEAIGNLLNPTRGRSGTTNSLTADTGATDFDTTQAADDDDADTTAGATADTTAVRQIGNRAFGAATMAPAPADGAKVVRAINTLLRGEISAAETYRDALEKVADGDHAEHAGLLREIQKEHGRACQTLRDRIRELGGEATDSSGVWGAWSQIVQGTMSLFGGDKGAIKALKEGEEHGLKDYISTVPTTDPTTAQLIQNQLIPAQRRHILMLDQMIAAV
jgi:uncharacterized protein (TIGR02284 family)